VCQKSIPFLKSVTTATSNSEYDSDTAQSDSAQSEVSYIGRKDTKKAHPSATICKTVAVNNNGTSKTVKCNIFHILWAFFKIKFIMRETYKLSREIRFLKSMKDKINFVGKIGNF
jgi:hypothetical protein